MRRLTTALTADEFGRAALNLGRADENAAVRVEIDLSAILAQEPNAAAHLTVESPSGAKYPASTTMDGGKLIWDVSDADTAAEGTGRAQLTVTGPGGEVLKSAVAVTRVGHSLRGEGEAPEPLKSWVDDATNKLGAVVQAGENAEKAAAKANAAAKAANTGEAARVEAETDRANAEKERATAETSRANAETQRANAEGARATAEQGRVAAEQGRVAAEQERASAEAARETAEAARRAALGGLSFAVNEDDGGLDITYTYTETEG